MSDLQSFLRRHEVAAEAWPVWGHGRIRLRQHTYLSQEMPPDELITSVRAVLFRGHEVMVIQDHTDDPYIVPGGRREAGESVLETLHREVLEETGWRLKQTAVLGFVHYRHLTPEPEGHPYPYPDFIQVIYTAVAGTFHPEAIEPDEYVTSSRFQPIADVMDLALKPGQQALLTAAIDQYEAMR